MFDDIKLAKAMIINFGLPTEIVQSGTALLICFIKHQLH